MCSPYMWGLSRPCIALGTSWIVGSALLWPALCPAKPPRVIRHLAWSLPLFKGKSDIILADQEPKEDDDEDEEGPDEEEDEEEE